MRDIFLSVKATEIELEVRDETLLPPLIQVTWGGKGNHLARDGWMVLVLQ